MSSGKGMVSCIGKDERLLPKPDFLVRAEFPYPVLDVVGKLLDVGLVLQDDEWIDEDLALGLDVDIRLLRPIGHHTNFHILA